MSTRPCTKSHPATEVGARLLVQGHPHLPGAIVKILERAVIDLHNGTTLSINSSALEVACPPARNCSENLRTIFEIVLLKI
jgi:hypothetical protein